MEFFDCQTVLVAHFRKEHLPYFLRFGIIRVSICITKSVVDDAENVTPRFWVTLLEKNCFEGNEEDDKESKHCQALSGEINQEEVNCVVGICKESILRVPALVKDDQGILRGLSVFAFNRAHQRFCNDVKRPLSIVVCWNQLLSCTIFSIVESFIVVNRVNERTTVCNEEDSPPLVWITVC